MGKRSNFERIDKDYYRTTDPRAVLPLLPHVSGDFSEPCAGDGALKDLLVQHGLRCDHLSDIAPQAYNVQKVDAFCIQACASKFITNPPWTRSILHPMINHLRVIAPTWLLFDAGWKHTKQSIPYMKYCEKCVSVGRLKWFADSEWDAKDDCAWYLFGATEVPFTEFYKRTEV